MSKPAFHGDWAVQQYDFTNSVLQVSIPSLSTLLQHHVSESIRELLHRDPQQRPSAFSVQGIFTSYVQLLNLPLSEDLLKAQSYPLYVEWKQLGNCHSDDPEFLFHLADM
jgi:hypothetical protein